MAQTPEGGLKLAASAAGMTVEGFLGREAAGLKRCRVCQGWRPVGEFSIDRSRRDGRKTRCHPCDRVKVRVNRKGRPSTFKGRTHSAEAKARISAIHKGKIGPNKGIPRTPEVRAKISATNRISAPRGPACHAYKDGKAAERHGERFSAEYKRWRFDVFSRDGFRCQDCGDARGGNLHAHHIQSFADHPNLRTVLSNGVTLCEGCHKARHR